MTHCADVRYVLYYMLCVQEVVLWDLQPATTYLVTVTRCFYGDRLGVVYKGASVHYNVTTNGCHGYCYGKDDKISHY